MEAARAKMKESEDRERIAQEALDQAAEACKTARQNYGKCDQAEKDRKAKKNSKSARG